MIENVRLYNEEKAPKRHDFSSSYLRESPGELHVLGGRVAALQEPRLAVHFHQTLVVIVVDGWAQHPQLELLGAGVVDVLEGDRNNRIKCVEPIRLRSYVRSVTETIPLNSLVTKSSLNNSIQSSQDAFFCSGCCFTIDVLITHIPTITFAYLI